MLRYARRKDAGKYATKAVILLLTFTLLTDIQFNPPVKIVQKKRFAQLFLNFASSKILKNQATMAKLKVELFDDRVLVKPNAAEEAAGVLS